MTKITIIGTGMIGTSLGLAIKRSGYKDLEIVGTDRDRGNATKALNMGALDKTSGNLMDAVEGAMVVIIATPLMAMKGVMEVIGQGLEDGCLVTDTGSAKGVVMEWAEEFLPRHVNFVGGHPIVLIEGSGPEAADAALFEGRPYCVIPGARARQDAVRGLVDIVQGIGAVDRFLDVDEHDSLAAAVHHLPLLLSAALVGCTSKSPSWDDIAQVASSTFGDMTRLVEGDTTVNRDTVFCNEAGTVAWIDAFIRELYDMRQILTSDSEKKLEEIQEFFARASDARGKWLSGTVMKESRAALERARVAPSSGGIMSIFTGDKEARDRVFGWGGGRMRGRDFKD